jgi:hypothetical protein
MMNGLPIRASMIILFAAMVLIARPIIFFSSAVVQTALCQETRAFGLVKIIRKRKERLPLMEAVREEEKRLVPTAFFPLNVLLIKKWLCKIRILIAQFFAAQFFLKRRRTVFEVRPFFNYIIALSTFRI